MDDPNRNPMEHPDEQRTGVEGEPKFGRLVAILLAAVFLISLLTVLTEWFHS